MSATVVRRLLLASALVLASATACTDDSDGRSDIPTGEEAIEREPWTVEDHPRLTETEVAGYTVGQDIEAGDALVRTFFSDPDPEGVTLVVRARFSPCETDSCWDPDEETEDAISARVREVVPTDHLENPDLVLEQGPDELAPDFEGFGVFHMSFVDTDTYSLGYQFRYHDDVNLIEMLVYPQGAATPTNTQELAAQMPRAWANEVAADVFAAFAEEFNATAD